ncbi:MAG: hypothetical protein A2566_03280 [Candidatus Zambryskibacteria bacterium RIFOXYD1_FULL_40_13]|nr:MAG: hypothetical protein UT25_C0002G0033 [Parcubacteria group bacterium GW2011_GWC1_39_12]KKR19468.1 MAG: hypothetical protein UT49_C0002G0314 [Parcubacteria group bacterium GW2011_GWF1_39_37]KKR35094.1 MAG: hypothetical protein UT68_C0005G0043 [Parcubacteria group bacterium GW2011_GWC2_40_10]KKR52417.1 MAG: hypothetical protein UT89_C0002G0218 [Parcubacteria group bacterium GW2011_GWE1_40_20]KKR64859.1 MAG: hypothetical protein UU06_C0037G0017 [Parcubacteria group bacterium GW2011_GWB1_40_
MLNIKEYLEKFSKGLRSEETDKEKIIETIDRLTQIKITKNQIETKNYVLFIKTTPLVSNKIFIHKEEILKGLSLSLSQKIVDIR